MSQLKSRMNVINILYVYELTGEKPTMETIAKDFILEEKEIKMLEWIIKKYEPLKNIISKFLKQGWGWKRIAPLERAMMLYGALELSFKPKPVVINEIVTLAKGYIYEDSYKFINAILDKVAGEYENQK